MRVAILSDIHGNRTAFKAVLRDLSITAPDLILHGGDLADAGASPTEIIDQIRDLKWHGVYGNTDEMLYRPASLDEFAAPLPQLKSMFDQIAEMAAWTRQQLGADRLDWLSTLPFTHIASPIALVHASPASAWRTTTEDGFEILGQPLAVHGHTHKPFITPKIANSGSVGQPHDGDPRASYLLIEDAIPSIRRVEYDLERELETLKNSGLPYADWIARILKSAQPQMP